MGQRPSNTLFYVLISLVVIFGLYIVGGFILDARQEDPLESHRQFRGVHGC